GSTPWPSCRPRIRSCARPAGWRAPTPPTCAAGCRPSATWPWPACRCWRRSWPRPSPRAARWRARSPACARTAWPARFLSARQRFELRLAAGDPLELRAADRHVALVAADLHLRPFAHRRALRVHAHGHRRLAAAVADGLDLADLVGPGQQVLAALEQLAAEIRAQPVAQHRHAQRGDHLAQRPDLGPAEELG